ATTYASINLAPGATYNYRVSAVNNDGASLPSQPSYATTQNAPNISISAAPTNLLATPVSGTEINLSWTAPQNAAAFTGYRIERENGIGNGFYMIVYNTSTTATNYADTNLAPGAIYNYHAAAMYGYGAGVFSASASTSTLTQPGAPRNVKAVSGNNQATISWLPPSYGGTVSNYVIFNGLNSSTTATANATSAIITGLTNGSYYSFSVAASNAAGTGMSVSAEMVMPQAQAFSSLITFSQVTSTAIATPQTPSSSQTIINPSLTQITSSSNYVFTAPLMKGARGKAVTELQKRLVALEYLKVEPTGYFGILTEAAVKAYQIARNIEAFGGVGPLTRAVLNSGK
ncbi:MAG: fibronectin type III domain-containing protein, partial [Candidatus Wolfebacteria bacterium]|nr:fibronectin type III domain-containing protein [Candidatus Wolfebacteria bacterium]